MNEDAAAAWLDREWAAALEEDGDREAAVAALRRCLRSAARRLRKFAIEYPVPLRIGWDQLAGLLAVFLERPSNGLRPLAVTTALMGALGEAFGLFPRVESQGLNEPDAAAGMPADVMCYGPDGDLRLAVEVKDRELTLADVEATLAKARSSELANVMFAPQGIRPQDEAAVRSRIADEWARGANVYCVTIAELARSAFALLDEGWRVRFARAVGAELERRAAGYRHRREWADLLAQA